MQFRDCETGSDAVGMDGVDANSIFRQFVGHRLRQACYPVLGRCVVTEKRKAFQSGDRTCEDDCAAGRLFDQDRHRRFGGVEGTVQVVVDGRMPVIEVDFPGQGGGGHACIGDDHIESAQFADSVFDRGFEGVEIGNVGDACDDPPAVLLDQPHCFLEVFCCGAGIFGGGQVCADVEGDDVCAFSGEADCFGAALPQAAPVMKTTLPS